MFNLVFYTITFTPLIGVILMESGAVGPNVGIGSPNGASVAYGIHLLVMYAAYWGFFRLLAKRFLQFPPPAGDLSRNVPLIKSPGARTNFRMVASLGIALQFTCLAFTIFGLGATEVLGREMGRGEFRASFGNLGIVAYTIRDFVAPSVCALCCAVYVLQPKRSFVDRLLLMANLVLLFSIVFVWGYRAGALFALVPCFLILFERLRFRNAILILGCSFVAAALTNAFYAELPLDQSFEEVAERATVTNGDVPWKVWDIYTSGERFPSYWPTLASCLGNRLASAIGIYSRDSSRWYYYEFAPMLTLVVKGYASSVDALTSNVTGGPFSAGIIAFGSPGFVLISAFSGCLAAANRFALSRARLAFNPIQLTLLGIYFNNSALGLLVSGDIVTLFGLSLLVNYGLVWILCKMILRVGRPGLPAIERQLHAGAAPTFQQPVKPAADKT